MPVVPNLWYMGFLRSTGSIMDYRRESLEWADLL